MSELFDHRVYHQVHQRWHVYVQASSCTQGEAKEGVTDSRKPLRSCVLVAKGSSLCRVLTLPVLLSAPPTAAISLCVPLAVSFCFFASFLWAPPPKTSERSSLRGRRDRKTASTAGEQTSTGRGSGWHTLRWHGPVVWGSGLTSRLNRFWPEDYSFKHSIRHCSCTLEEGAWIKLIW